MEFSLGSTSDAPDLATPYYLPSATQHPEVIDKELGKECAAGRIIEPFQSSPLPNFHCSGLGAVPK